MLASARVRSVPAAAVVVGVAAAAWVALAAGAGHTTHHEVLGSGHAPHPAAVAALLAGWLIMVAAMMLPPALAPAGGRTGGGAGRWWAEAGAVTATTCAVWTGFGSVALAGDAVLHRLADSWPWLAGLIAPAVLLGTGTFQRSACRQRLLGRVRDASRPPWRHAICCLGSCWAPMLVVFAMAVGSLIWMAALTVLMTVERGASPRLASLTGPLVGYALIGAGVLAVIQPGLFG